MHRRVLLHLQRAELTGDPKVSTACDTASGQEKRAPLRVQKSEKTHHCLCAVDAAPQQQFAMHATAPPAQHRTFAGTSFYYQPPGVTHQKLAGRLVKASAVQDPLRAHMCLDSIAGQRRRSSVARVTYLPILWLIRDRQAARHTHVHMNPPSRGACSTVHCPGDTPRRHRKPCTNPKHTFFTVIS